MARCAWTGEGAPTAPVAAFAVALAGANAFFVLVLIYMAFQQQSAPDIHGRTISVPGFASSACGALLNALAGVMAARVAGLFFAIAGGLLVCITTAFGITRIVRGLK